jgi:hypothetical protein
MFAFIASVLLFAATPTPAPVTNNPVFSQSDAIQEFASKLSPLHQQIFCNQFNGDQRAEVLAILLSKSPKYTGVTPDEAVEVVLKESRSKDQKAVSCQPSSSQAKSRYSQRRRTMTPSCSSTTNPATNM